MLQELWKMDLEALKTLYIQENTTLTEALLDGATWQEVADKRKMISQLSLIIERKSAGLDHPAENKNR